METTRAGVMRIATVSPAGLAQQMPSRWAVRPTTVLRVTLLLYALANLGRIPLLDLGDRAAPLLINDIAVGLVLVAGALTALHARSLRMDVVCLAALIFAFIGATAATLAVPRYGLSGFELLASLAYLARWLVYFCLYVVVINWVRRDDAPRIWAAVEHAILAMAAFGIVQAIFLPDFAFMVAPKADGVPATWDLQGHRLVSTMLEPNVMAAVLGVALLVQLASISSGVRIKPWKPLLLLTALLMTLSRGGIASFGVGCTVILATRGLSKRMLKFGALAAILAVPAMPRLMSLAKDYNRFSVSDPSAVSRVTAWVRALGAFAEHPWFGIGFNTYGFVQERRGFERMGGQSYSAEGGLLFIMVMTGIVGLAVFLFMLYFVAKRCRAGWRTATEPWERGLFIGTAAATLTVLVDSVFVNSLLTPWVMELLWVLWGLTFVVTASLRQRAHMRPT